MNDRIPPNSPQGTDAAISEDFAYVRASISSLAMYREAQAAIDRIEAASRPKPSDAATARARLVLEIELPDYYLDDIPEAFAALSQELTDDAFAEEAENAMQLASENVGVVLTHYSGDDPTLCVKAMDGLIVGIRVKR